ncbi:MAG TPA: hypothetical protein VNA57_01135 [Acidimicrobiales bacterium]|nr:hypothetical protein [Acidimicrobiales bacterium]
MPNAPTEYRFLVDEASLGLGELERAEVEAALDNLAEQLSLARERHEAAGIISGFELFECRPGVLLYELLTSDEISRDCRVRIFGLLDKCGRFDTHASFYVDPNVEVDGHPVESYAIATVLETQRSAVAIGAFGLVPPYGPGVVKVADASGDGQAVVVTGLESRLAFYRWIYATEDVEEARFFNLVPLAFPYLRFAEGITFRRFEGSYADLRDQVVFHLGKINDGFRTAYVDHYGRPDEVSAAMDLDISMESTNTRKSERLMRERDATYDGRTYRCEWHSKIEPHRNRIHLHPGDDLSDHCVVVGIFVKHLST